ncbi:MAG: hypothetical protein ABL951_08080 [Alphaproteobacteria bacterium]
MADNVTNELIYEILKQLQTDMAAVTITLADHTRQFIRVREELNGLRGDDIRRRVLQAQMDHRLERIEKRLSPSDA